MKEYMDAVEKGFVEIRNPIEHQDRDRRRKAPETGGSDRVREGG